MGNASSRGQAVAIRRLILEQAHRANVGHVGSALSVADIVLTLLTRVLAGTDDDPDRDRLVLSNGHTALALYAALHLTGLLTSRELDTYCADGSQLGVHPQHALRGIDFSTGSLGQGLSIAAGAALAARLQRSARRAFAVLSDAECNEGAVWEAIAFAAHHRLDNLFAVVDLNGQQALGYTKDVLDMSPLVDRWRAFDWDVREVDGHDHDQVQDALERSAADRRPRVLIARTVFGQGVSFMRPGIDWHYLPLSDDQYREALAELEGEVPLRSA